MAPRFRLLILLASALLALLAVSSASASEIVTRNAKNVEREGRREGSRRHLLHGGRQAVPPGLLGRGQRAPAEPDSGAGRLQAGLLGWLHEARDARSGRTSGTSVVPYAGPALAWYVTGCTAPDGSHWVLQSWQRRLPNLGMAPWLRSQRVWELHLSHFTGDPAVLEIYADYIYYGGLYHHLFGRLTYKGKPVYGFENTEQRQPDRHLRAERLRRHLQLALCERLETRERLPLAPLRRHVLLRLLSPRALRVLPGWPTPAAGERRGLSRDRDRPRSQPRRLLVGSRPPRVDELPGAERVTRSG